MKIQFILLLVFGLLAQESIAQKVKIKNEIASVEGEEYVRIKRAKGANAASIYEIGSGEEVIFARWLNYNTATNNNPQTRVNWIELKFLNLDISCEIDNRGYKGLVRFLKDNGVFVNGVLDEEAARKVVQKYGNNFSANRPESVIIINN